MVEPVRKYLDNFLAERSPLLLEMEAYAQEHKVPVMEPEGVDVMLHLMGMIGARSVLEIGTAIGYSALRMASGIDGLSVVTIERDVKVANIARDFIERSSCGKHVKLIEADALSAEAVRNVAQFAPFDCIFIDAAKGQYQRFFELYEGFLSSGGIIFTDNVLLRGLLEEGAAEGVSRRAKSWIRKVDQYNHWLQEHEGFRTVILPVGDGLAVSYKRGEVS